MALRWLRASLSSRPGTEPFLKSGNYLPSPASGNQRKTPQLSGLQLAAETENSSCSGLGTDAPVMVESQPLCVEEAKWSLLFLALPGVRIPFISDLPFVWATMPDFCVYSLLPSSLLPRNHSFAQVLVNPVFFSRVNYQTFPPRTFRRWVERKQVFYECVKIIKTANTVCCKCFIEYTSALDSYNNSWVGREAGLPPPFTGKETESSEG